MAAPDASPADSPPVGPAVGRSALGGVVAGLALLLAGAGWYVSLDTISTHAQSRLLQEGFGVAKAVMKAQGALSSFLTTRDAGFQQEYLAGLGGLTQEADELKKAAAALGTPESVSITVDQINATVREWDTQYARKAIGLKRYDGKSSGQRGADTRRLNKLNEQVERGKYAREFGVLLESLDARLEAAALAYREWIRARQLTAVAVAVSGLLLVLASGWMYIRRRHIMLDHLRSRSARLEEIADFERRLHHVTSADLAARHLRAAAGRHGARCAVLLRRDLGPGLRIADESGPAPAGAEKSPVLQDHAVCPVMRTGSRFAIRDVAVEPACDCPAAAPKTGGYLCEPLLAQGQVAGLVNWQAGPGRVLRDRDTDHVEELARATSLVLSNLFTLEGAQHDANTDPLTGVSNRRFLDGYLAKQIAVAGRQQRPLAVLMLDLDRFKSFNDRHGHPAGDALLRAAAAEMQRQVRDGDLVARYGGEEFTVVLPEADRAAALDIAGRIRAGVEAMRVDALPALSPPVVTISIGLALAPDHGATAGALLQAADGALYRAKQEGRNRVVEAAAPG